MKTNKIIYCTSMSKEGFESYGYRLLESWSENMESELLVVSEDILPDKYDNVALVENYWSDVIRERYKDFNKVTDYRFRPDRFVFKTSAVEVAFSHVKTSKYSHLCWIDADSKIIGRNLVDVTAHLLPKHGQIASFFDRTNSYGYSETGFFILDIRNIESKIFVQDWNDAFISRDIENYSEWHDAFFFSHLVQSRPPGMFRFLCNDFNLKSNNPVWELKFLRDNFIHLKGDVRKSLGFSPESIPIVGAKVLKVMRLFYKG